MNSRKVMTALFMVLFCTCILESLSAAADGLPSAMGVFRDRWFYLDSNGILGWNPGEETSIRFGKEGDVPLAGDWDGDGATDVGVFRNGWWYLDSNGTPGWQNGEDTAIRFGKPDDVPVAGDWDGDGATDVGVFRNGTWYLDSNGTPGWNEGDASVEFGNAADVPIVGDWDGDGTANVGVFRDRWWYLDSNGEAGWQGDEDTAISFGKPDDVPVSGTWAWTGSTAYKLPDTGQTKSFTGTYGEDADYLIRPPSYTDGSNGTITDNVTGLMWQKEDDNTTRAWADAVTYCADLELGGHTDWRLPNNKEISTIIDYSTYNPSINDTYFPNTNASYYWSTNPLATDDTNAWYGDFSTGGLYYYSKTWPMYVRCVRGDEYTGPSLTNNGTGTISDSASGLMWQQCSAGQAGGTCSGLAGGMNWEEALAYCEGLSLADYDDWRLPNIKELKSVVDESLNNPAINETYFPNNSANYWASTTNTASPLSGWHVYLTNGMVGSGPVKSSSIYVRCVR